MRHHKMEGRTVMLYWPCATYINSNGEEVNLITYEGYDTLNAAKHQIQFWADWYGFTLTEAHIDIYPSGNKTCVAVLNLQKGIWEDV